MTDKQLIKSLERILENEFYDEENNLVLYEIDELLKKNGKQLPFKHSMLSRFYDDYAEYIALWLCEPLPVIQAQIKSNNFTESENRLILTNILLKLNKERKEEEEDDEYIY